MEKKVNLKPYIIGLAIFSLILVMVFNYSFFDKEKYTYELDLPDKYDQALVIRALDFVFSIRPINARGSKIQEKDNVIKYIDAYENTDIVQTKYVNKLKEDIILKQPGHPEEFGYQINIEEYDWNMDEDNNLVFYKKGKRDEVLDKEITIPAPFMIDSKGAKSLTSDVEMFLSRDGILVIRPSKEWLERAVYPVTLDPTIEINILNVHSHPQEGDNWEVSFTTQNKADLKIIPDDQATIDDDEFVSLWCGDEQRSPEILEGDVIYYKNWSCSGIGKVIHFTKKAGHHTLKFEFGGQVAYAYNAPGDTVIYITSNTSTCGANCWTIPNDWSDANLIEVIGGGGGGGTDLEDASGGGGGGAYASTTLASLSGNITFSVGAGGTEGLTGGSTWFNGAACVGSSVCANGGGGATDESGTSGGTVQEGTGYSGGAGGAGGAGKDDGGGGGGGAAGPTGVGGNGGARDGDGGGGGGGAGSNGYSAGNPGSAGSGDTGGAGGDGPGGGGGTEPGGAGTAGTGGGGAGGTDNTTENGGNGGTGVDWISGTGAGGGGGGGADVGEGGNGGLYGGGGGGYSEGGDTTDGDGAQGIIVITYTPIFIPAITSVSATSAKVGETLTFLVKWSDADAGENIKAKICSTNSLTGTNCTASYFASSTAFTTNNPESIATTTLSAWEGTNDFYAFVCDDDNYCSDGYYGHFYVGYITQINSSLVNKYTSGLVGYWTFDGQDMDWSANSAIDRSGQGNNGIMTNMSTTTSPVRGVSGQGLEFDGVDDYAAIGDTTQNIKTLAFWMKADSTTEDIIDLDGGVHTASSTSGTITANGWASPTVYVDGVVASTITTDWHFVVFTTDTPINANDMDMGRVGSSYFEGKIDEVRLYNRVLSASEVQDLYRAGDRTIQVNSPITQKYTGGLVGNWTFNGPDMDWSANSAIDRSGLGNNGIMTNMSTTTSPVRGVSGQGLKFDGVDDYAAIGDTTQNIKTLAFWMKADSTTEDIIDLDGGTHSASSTSSTITANGWASPTVYVDGAVASTITTDWHFIVFTTDTPINANDMDIGRVGLSYFDGSIDEVRFYNRVLSASEVQDLYRAGDRRMRIKN